MTFEQGLSPKIALIGRPNVGKSTLFNRLTGSKDALVAERPGLTRDRRYGNFGLAPGIDCTLIDTGGVATDLDDPLSREVIHQTRLAIKEADLLILLLDGNEGLVADDIILMDMARRSQTPFLVVVNKVDSTEKRLELTSFYEIGASSLTDISARSGRGIRELKKKVASILFPKKSQGWEEGIEDETCHMEDKSETSEENCPESQPVKVSIIGRPNVGKSSLLNRLLGEPRMVVSDMPGTTRDAIDCIVERKGKPPLVFIDTAGVRRRSRVKDKIEKFSVIKSIDSIKKSDICICVFDCTEGITDQDRRLVGYTARYGKGCITVFNKWDLVKDDPRIRKLLREEARLLKKIAPYSPHLNISALTGKNAKKIFGLIDSIYRDYTYRETTGKLNRLLKEALLKKNPPVTKGHYLKIYYMTQTGTKPPAFTFFANYPELFPEHFKRYLGNFFRTALGIENSPVKIILRSR